MKKIEIDIYCLLCSNNYKTEIELPTDFVLNDLTDENALCADHAGIKEWRNTVCRGCVGGFGSCDLWQGFAYKHERNKLTEEEMQVIETGRCPRKTSGWLMVSRATGIVNITPTDIAPEAGKLFAKAIREYIEEYRNE